MATVLAEIAEQYLRCEKRAEETGERWSIDELVVPSRKAIWNLAPLMKDESKLLVELVEQSRFKKSKKEVRLVTSAEIAEVYKRLNMELILPVHIEHAFKRT